MLFRVMYYLFIPLFLLDSPCFFKFHFATKRRWDSIVKPGPEDICHFNYYSYIDLHHSVTLDRFRKLHLMRYESAEACRVRPTQLT